jgi:hypothetical protein
MMFLVVPIAVDAITRLGEEEARAMADQEAERRGASLFRFVETVTSPTLPLVRLYRYRA